MSIRMRVNNNKESRCQECRTKWINTAEMFDIQICNQRFTLCHRCFEQLEHKSIKMSVLYNAKVKGPQDLKRAQNERKLIARAEEREG